MKKDIEVKNNISLKEFTTFKIGGSVDYFCQVKDKDEIIAAISLAKEKNLPVFVLGGGSNILFSDEGFRGMVIKIANSGIEIKDSLMKAGAGASLAQAVSVAKEEGLTGLEWAFGIPGTVGGATYGNAGAFEKSFSDIIKSVEVFDIKEEKIKIFSNKDCAFSYRESFFKKNKNFIILSVEIVLEKGDKKEIENKMREFFDLKRESQPLSFPSAGSVFKNPSTLSAASLIEKCGLKGKQQGAAKISEKHSNFIVNLGGASAKDVLDLINLAKKEVKTNFGVDLQEEIQIIPSEIKK